MILQYECSGQAIWGARTGRTCDLLHVTKALRLMEWAGHKVPAGQQADCGWACPSDRPLEAG